MSVQASFDKSEAHFLLRTTKAGHFQAVFKKDSKDRGAIVAQLPALAVESLPNFRWLVGSAAGYHGVEVIDEIGDEQDTTASAPA